MTAPKSHRLDWFRKARFGMFVHWGLYAVPAGQWKGTTSEGEWIHMNSDIPGRTYEGFAKRFDAAGFDADRWVALARRAGMKYLVFTAKHHDGFCMFDSRQTGYNVVDATPFGRDPLKELSRACREQGLVFCIYYSVKDWHHREYPREMTWRDKGHPDGFHAFPNPRADYLRYLDYMEAQLRELLTDYGPVGIVWFDWGPLPEGAAVRRKARRIERMMRRLQPDCLINNRWEGIRGDYGTPEQTIPGAAQAQAFEVCMTMNDHWGYNRRDHNWKDAATVVRNLVDVVSKGGNYLLNVGPTAEGVIPRESTRILERVGRWMAINGESVHGADASPIPTRWIKDIRAITVKPGRYYLHVFDWPRDGRLFLYEFQKKQLLKAYLLADPKRRPLRAEVHPRSLMLHVPKKAPDPLDSVVVVEWREKRGR